MSESRVWFPDSPWGDEGHAIKTFNWTAETFEGDIWFLFRLETENYDSDSPGKAPASDDAPKWQQPEAWQNFDRSLIYTEDGFCVSSEDDYDVEELDGRTFAVDPLPLDKNWAEDELIFQSYILGHDSVADHRITLTRRLEDDHFDIDWTCKVALTYSGEREFSHGFRAEIKDIALPETKPMEVPVD